MADLSTDKESIFMRRVGRMITTGFKYEGEFQSDSNSLVERMLKAEQYLNDRVATEVHKKFGVAVRFHL